MERQTMRGQRIIIGIIDILCIASSAILSNYIIMNIVKRSEACGYPVSLEWFVLFVCLAYVLCKVIFNENVSFFKRGILKEVGVVVKSSIVLLISISVVSLVIGSDNDFSRMAIGAFLGIQFVSMVVTRCLYKAIIMNSVKNGKLNCKNLLIMTTSDRADSVISKLKFSSNMWDYRFNGIILMDSLEKDIEYGGIPVVANYSDMYDYVKRAAVDEIFINMQYQNDIPIKEMVEIFESMGVTVNVSVGLYDEDIKYRRRVMNDFGGYYVITYSPEFFNPCMMFIKRVMDIAGAIVGLMITAVVTVFLAPILLIESPGPLFFSQMRIGKNGRKFKIYKFRSMYADAEERKKELLEKNEMNGLMFKMENDPRITKVGKFIRKTSIDELPQFWNILKGDMSLVGTRPPTVDEFEQYEARHKRRVSIVPGLTGLWQISGRSNIKDFEEVVNIDLEYIDNWSIWLDIKIILQTILIVFKGSGAK